MVKGNVDDAVKCEVEGDVDFDDGLEVEANVES